MWLLGSPPRLSLKWLDTVLKLDNELTPDQHWVSATNKEVKHYNGTGLSANQQAWLCWVGACRWKLHFITLSRWILCKNRNYQPHWWLDVSQRRGLGLDEPALFFFSPMNCSCGKVPWTVIHSHFRSSSAYLWFIMSISKRFVVCLFGFFFKSNNVNLFLLFLIFQLSSVVW